MEPVQSTLDEAAEQIICKATDLLDRPNGWIKGAYTKTVVVGEERIVQYCLVGALQAAADIVSIGAYGAAYVHAALRVEEEIGKRTRMFQPGLTIWNDHPKRTQEQVVNLLRRLCGK